MTALSSELTAPPGQGAAAAHPAQAQPLKIAILAMGGEGGGVLADWLVDLAEQAGHIAQTTSVPGVAQRTGATLYYVEMFPAAAAQAAGAAPVLALMPLPGDVDVVVASELMEAGRAVQRGLVTPGRTTVITSTHRVYAIAEKVAMGDGRADPAALLAQVQAAAQRCLGFDMAQAAEEAGSVISAVLFGTLAASGALPFSREAFEATITRGGVGVKASLGAFGAAFDRTARGAAEPPVARVGTGGVLSVEPDRSGEVGLQDSSAISDAATQALARARHPAVRALLERAAAQFAGPALALVVEGLRRLVDYQDPAYAALYLDRLEAVRRQGPASGPAAGELLQDLARHLALWMSWEDTLRVADLKTRGSRFDRVRGEVRAGPDQLLAIHEYLHPRLQEIAETLPPVLGRWLLASGLPRRLVQRLTRSGRVVQTSSLRGFALLSFVASLRRWRRHTWRYALETQRIEAWLADIHTALAEGHPALALEITRCQRLVKGYGDTHERGLRNYDTLRAAWARQGARLAPAALAELRSAALADEQGQALAAALQRYGLA